MIYDPSEDGKTHLNIYSKARTALGLFLSNFTEVELETDDGPFVSVEAYWYWLSTAADHPERDILRTLYGWVAKKKGRELRGPDYDADGDVDFQKKIKKVLRYKIENSKFKKEFTVSTLPFAHYYVHFNRVIVPESGQWQTAYFEELRKEFKERDGQVPIM